ncbi:MAG: YceI family protein [Actinomycetota bacterium]|nr:YceI family protein [Actinomycetota bacterium]
MTTITATSTSLPVGTWHVDQTHSHVGFELDYMGGVFGGSFSPVEATLTVGDDGVRLEGSARADAVKVQDENLNAHLLSPEFFDAPRTPVLSFAATGVRRTGDEVAIDGELTIRGTTRPIELRGTVGEPITDAYGRERFALRLEGTIDRTDFGLSWNIPLPSGEPALSNEVRLVGQLYLVRA